MTENLTESPSRNTQEGTTLSPEDTKIEKYKAALEKMVRAYDAQKEKLAEKVYTTAEHILNPLGD
jgi:hypothetical protein